MFSNSALTSHMIHCDIPFKRSARLTAMAIENTGIAFYFLSLVLKSIPVGVAYAVWSGLGVVIITAIAWLLHGQKLDAWGFVGMGLIIAAFLLARSPSWKSLRRPTPW
ncbi:QacE family quaternary ammonium compound efflux SMR transporter [Acinetobacter baumannii]|nr:QacE family quaternary ammonium compound efflux SMR transporter [Acinetobacter baumannii]